MAPSSWRILGILGARVSSQTRDGLCPNGIAAHGSPDPFRPVARLRSHLREPRMPVMASRSLLAVVATAFAMAGGCADEPEPPGPPTPERVQRCLLERKDVSRVETIAPADRTSLR